MNQTLSLIASRRSHRAYQPTQLNKEQLDALLTAALQAPSAMNRQPWHFTVVQDQELLDRINAAARRQAMSRAPAQRSPRFQDDAFHIFYHAPTVIFLSGDPNNAWTQIDCGIAVGNIVLAAESLGLGSVILGLPKDAFLSAEGPALCQALSFPAGWNFIIAIAVGTPADDKNAHPQAEGKITLVESAEV